jgi:hypothetical protein
LIFNISNFRCNHTFSSGKNQEEQLLIIMGYTSQRYSELFESSWSEIVNRRPILNDCHLNDMKFWVGEICGGHVVSWIFLIFITSHCMVILKKLEVLKINCHKSIKSLSHINGSYTIKYFLLWLVSSFLKIMNVNVYETCKLLFLEGRIIMNFYGQILVFSSISCCKVNLATTTVTTNAHEF